jgi:transketolase
MRNAFLETLFQLAGEDERITFITGDLGFRVVEKFMEERPRQFLNAGVAEQNMTSMAAGMALEGRIVFTYSIANFPTLRCLEQVRNDICYHDANVKVVSVGGGFAYGSLGATHHALEDLAVMRAMPGMAVVAPGDPVETRAATRAVAAHPGPCYLRLGKAGEPVVHEGTIEFQLGKAIRFRDGSDLTLITTGGMLRTAARAAERLAQDGIQTRVLSMHTLKPLDADALRAAATETGVVVTLEEHSVIGGLGGAVAEFLAEAHDLRVPFARFGMPSMFSPHMGTQEYMLAQHGLDAESVADALKAMLAKRAPSRPAAERSEPREPRRPAGRT